jgi:hypothetical protein
MAENVVAALDQIRHQLRVLYAKVESVREEVAMEGGVGNPAVWSRRPMTAISRPNHPPPRTPAAYPYPSFTGQRYRPFNHERHPTARDLGWSRSERSNHAQSVLSPHWSLPRSHQGVATHDHRYH